MPLCCIAIWQNTPSHLGAWKCFHTIIIIFSHITGNTLAKFVLTHFDRNQGFLRYFQAKQIPNFLLAAPMILLSATGIYSYLRYYDFKAHFNFTKQKAKGLDKYWICGIYF
jgi:hypothetical protein